MANTSDSIFTVRRDGAQTTRAFTRQRLIADAHTVDVGALPHFDFIVSSTALEHIDNDKMVIDRLTTRLRPNGSHIHFAPAAGSLALYGTHGWRQYTPIQLERLLPGALIHRIGEPFSWIVHQRCITARCKRQAPMFGERHPRLFAVLRSASIALDQATHSMYTTMYGVVWTKACWRKQPRMLKRRHFHFHTNSQKRTGLTGRTQPGLKRRQRPTFPRSSIIGGPGFTTVFGMGTGVSPDLWSPTNAGRALSGAPALTKVNRQARVLHSQVMTNVMTKSC